MNRLEQRQEEMRGRQPEPQPRFRTRIPWEDYAAQMPKKRCSECDRPFVTVKDSLLLRTMQSEAEDSVMTFPEGFWNWPEEKREQWIEKFIRDAIEAQRSKQNQPSSNRLTGQRSLQAN